jgi:hypothetical protein
MKKIISIITLSLVTLTLLTVCVVPGFTLAADQNLGYTPLSPLPGIESSPESAKLDVYLPAMVKFLIGIAGALAVIYIAIGGFMYISSTLPFTKAEGKKYIENALYGLLLAISAWIILYTVNPDILNIGFDVPDSATDLSGIKTGANPNASPSSEKLNEPHFILVKAKSQTQGESVVQTFCSSSYPNFGACKSDLDKGAIPGGVNLADYTIQYKFCADVCKEESVVETEESVVKMIYLNPNAVEGQQNTKYKIICEKSYPDLDQCKDDLENVSYPAEAEETVSKSCSKKSLCVPVN